MRPLLFALCIGLSACRPESTAPIERGSTLHHLLADTEALRGKADYLASPYVTAGDRLYMVGHQDGTFPDHGWHVEGEMGGIWAHPIKLMDGFGASVQWGGQNHCLDRAQGFANYPLANWHDFGELGPGLRAERFQFVPDGKAAVCIEFLFANSLPDTQHLTLTFNALLDLRPVWLGERTGMADAPDTIYWHEAGQHLVGKDRDNDWYAVWGAAQAPRSHEIGSQLCAIERRGLGQNAALSYRLSIPPHSQIGLPIVVAGSDKSWEEAKNTLAEVQRGAADLLRKKMARYAQLNAQSAISIPDTAMQRAYEWVKYNTDWLVREVPGIGRGLSAGMADYPWWFGCDNTYALQGVLATGRPELAQSSMQLLRDISEKTNGNGRVVHEVSSNGAVFNPGNLNETPHFASMVWTLYEWTGDRAMLESYFPFVQKGLAWLLGTQDRDSNLLPDGFGMMEIHGLDSEMIDVAVYTQQGLAAAARMAEELGRPALAADYAAKAAQLRERINSAFWAEDFASFADFIGNSEQARHLIDDAIVRADTLGKPWAVEELRQTRQRIADYDPKAKQGFVLHHNWVVNTPMEMGIADSAKALRALDTGARFVNPFGVFVTGIDRDDTAGSDDGSFAAGKKIFSYTGAVMTLPTGVMAIGENNYGRPDRALDYLQRLCRSFGYALPGSIYEVSPDFGMMAQAWNVYALNFPIVTQFFGIRPQAQKRQVRIAPRMPSTWDKASISQVRMGDNALSMNWSREGKRTRLRIEQSQADWEVQVHLPLAAGRAWSQDGKRLKPERQGDGYALPFTGARIELVIEEE